MNAHQPDERSLVMFTIPLGNGVLARIELPYRMSQLEWGQMFAVLEAMRPGIVIPELTVDKSLEVTFKRYP